MFLAFAGLAQAKAQLPLTLLLMCIAVVPVVTLTVSQYAGILSGLLVQGYGARRNLHLDRLCDLAAAIAEKSRSAGAALEVPVAAAALGTAIVLPVMLVYMLFGLTDAIPVLLTTVLLVAKMEEERGAASGWAKLIGNFLGGFVAVAGYYLLQVAPSLMTLALITFLIGFGFALQIVKGGVRGGNALLAYNATMVIFGLALLKGPANSGTWGARVVQFAIACTFAVGMMRSADGRASSVGLVAELPDIGEPDAAACPVAKQSKGPPETVLRRASDSGSAGDLTDQRGCRA